MEKQKRIFAVCDTEFSYAVSFMEYLNRKRTLPFEVHAFTSPEELTSFVKENPIEILLISDHAMNEEIRVLPIQQIMILSDGREKKDSGSYPNIYKYQSSDSVIREVMACYGRNTKDPVSLPAYRNRKLKILGVYAPIGRCGKTTFALTMGQILAKEKNVLYLNLETCSMLAELFDLNPDDGLSELLYYAREQKKGAALRIRSMVSRIQNLDILPPAANPEDLMMVTANDWDWLIGCLNRESSYEILILDFDTCFGDFLQLLCGCDLIFQPLREDKLAELKQRRFRQMLSERGDLHLGDRIHEIHLPAIPERDWDPESLKALVWNGYGEWVRKLLKKEGLL